MIASHYYDPISLRPYPTVQARQLALLLVSAEDANCDAGQPVSCQCDEPKNEHALTEAGEGERAGGAATGALAARAVAEAAEGAAEAAAAAASAGRSRRFSAGAARRAIADRVAHAMGGKARNDAP